MDILKYCGKAKQIRRDGAKPYVYQLLQNYVDAFKPTPEQVSLGEVDWIGDECA
jgi:hypothetical protein